MNNGFWDDVECSVQNDFICLKLRNGGTEQPDNLVSDSSYLSDDEADESQSNEDKRRYEPENMFDLIDANSNNEISRLEWFGIFGEHDRDGDFTMSPEELVWWLKDHEDIICHDYESLIDSQLGL
jgi:hypothetical protein